MSERGEVQPALSAEEWDTLGIGDVQKAMQNVFGNQTMHRDEAASRHALAALCLHGQPYGFTHEGLEAILDCIAGAGESGVPDAVRSRAEAEAEKIAALLPPQP